jgi:hypothetical protein
MEEEGLIGCPKKSCKKKAGIETSISWITQPQKKPNKQKQSQSQSQRFANSE